MSDKNYIYAVTRVRIKENSLLRDAFMKQLLQAENYESCISLLRDKGWDREGNGELQTILAEEENKTWKFCKEILKKDISRLDVFLYANDYLNLKSAIKESRFKNGYEGIYTDQGSIDPEIIKKAVSTKSFSHLPEKMGKVAEKGLDLFLKTGDGQLLDVMVDKAALEDIYDAAKKSGSKFLMDYAELTVAAADLKIALRAARTGKSIEFLESALAPCDSLNIKKLEKAAMGGEDSLFEFIGKTDYSDSIDALKTSISEFEKWCDNLMIKKIKPQKINSFGIEPIAAYVLGRMNEIKSVRIILSGKQNELPEKFLEERVREMYA